MKCAWLVIVTWLAAGSALAADEVPAHPHVRLDTTEGSILIELDGRRAPLTTQNFLRLVDAGHFNGTVFHRVIPDFMVQGGGYTRDLKEKETEGSVPNESGNGLENIRGTVAMARTADPHSANAQFFINVADNTRLDPQPDRWGYAVFAYVLEGMEVVDQIVSAPTGPAGQFSSDVPNVAVVIEKAVRVTYGE
jgi:cyclophilin family peptidyl-prolyl cis-trans isomerase